MRVRVKMMRSEVEQQAEVKSGHINGHTKGEAEKRQACMEVTAGDRH